MKGWSIFKHSVLLVLRNWKEALQIGLVPVGIVVVLFFALIGPGTMMALSTQNPDDFDPALAGPLFLVVAASVIAFLLIVVNWHRYVLLEEYPTGWIPRAPVGLALGYLGRFILLMLLAAFLMIPLGLVSMLAGPLAIVLLPAAALFISVVFYRLAIILPSGAIGQPIGFSAAWEATRGSSGTILVMMLCLFALNIVVQIIVTGFMLVLPLLGLLVSIVLSALVGLAGVSILTTLYGHYIEGRPID